MGMDEIPDVVTPADRPAIPSGCPIPWEAWFAELSTWANAASSPRWSKDGTVRQVAVGGMIHVHAVLAWDGASPVEVGQPCGMDSVFLACGGGRLGHGFMEAGSSGIILHGLGAGPVIIDGWYPVLLGVER